MKKYTLSRFLLLLSVLFIGCDEADFLSSVNPNQQTEETFWIDEASVHSALATIFSPMRNQIYGPFSGMTGIQFNNNRSDDTFPLFDDPVGFKYASFTNVPSDGQNDFGYFYQTIHRANTLLANIDRVEMSDEKKALYIAEATFLRGFAYFLVTQSYGEAPIRTTPATSAADVNIASSSEADLWKQVEADMKVAKAGLPIKRSTEEAGRVERGAAIAYLGKAYLFQKKFAEAKAELELLYNAPYTYDLVNDPYDNFHEEHKLNKESIFEFCYNASFGTAGGWGSESANSTQGMLLPQFIGPRITGGWFKMMPTASLIDAFVEEKRPAGSDSKFDKRMYTSLYFKHSQYGDNKPDENWFTMDFDSIWNSSLAVQSTMGAPEFSEIEGEPGRFLIKKYTNWWNPSPKGNDAMYTREFRNNNFRVMRFAEVILLHAEACAETGDIAGATADLKRIRDRAGLGQKNWTGADALIEEIRHQKLLEFCFEMIRWFDLKRWYNTTELKQFLIDRKKRGAENFEAKYMYMPIPESEINSNNLLQPHPLWR